jgi:hypothetical protein
MALSRLGSMRKVADAFGFTTSTVSQQIAALAKVAGGQLIEPDGRRVRLTPAGVSWPITRSPSWPLSTLHDSTSILKPNL